MTYNDLTIEKFIECMDVVLNPEITENYDREIAIASILSGKTVDYIEQADYDEANKLKGAAKALLRSEPSQKVKHIILIGGKPYKAITDIGQFSASRLLSTLHYNAQENRHRFLDERIALLYRPFFSSQTDQSAFPDQPLHDVEAVAKLIAKKKVGEVYGAVFFFKKLLDSSSLDIQAYLKLIQIRAQAESANLTRDRYRDRRNKGTVTKASASTTDGTPTSTSSPGATPSKKTS